MLIWPAYEFGRVEFWVCQRALNSSPIPQILGGKRLIRFIAKGW